MSVITPKYSLTLNYRVESCSTRKSIDSPLLLGCQLEFQPLWNHQRLEACTRFCSPRIHRESFPNLELANWGTVKYLRYCGLLSLEAFHLALFSGIEKNGRGFSMSLNSSIKLPPERKSLRLPKVFFTARYTIPYHSVVFITFCDIAVHGVKVSFHICMF